MKKAHTAAEAYIASGLLFFSGGLTIFWGLVGLVTYEVWSLLDVFIGILLVIIGYLTYKIIYLIVSSSGSITIGLALAIVFIYTNQIGGIWRAILVIIAGMLGFAARYKLTRQQKVASELLDILRSSRRIKIDELAKKLTIKEVDVELTVNRIKRDGVPIGFNRETREVILEKSE